MTPVGFRSNFYNGKTLHSEPPFLSFVSFFFDTQIIEILPQKSTASKMEPFLRHLVISLLKKDFNMKLSFCCLATEWNLHNAHN